MFLLETAAASGQAGSGGMLGMLGIYAVFIVILYLVMIRPQRKRQKQTEAMQNAVKIGDWVLINSGMYGKVVNIVNDCLIVEFGTNKSVMIPVLRSQIASVEEPDLTQKTADPNAVEPTDSIVGDDLVEDDLDVYDQKVLEQGEKKGLFKKKK
ncbi:MAG: preprotein translocase subunit YajC [Lachnospiraceae bacterium]|jgi:preprotein translocase subunit YajC|nr:preprotein translocase subunit YajC [Lachnospiraceae bacterium]